MEPLQCDGLGDKSSSGRMSRSMKGIRNLIDDLLVDIRLNNVAST